MYKIKQSKELVLLKTKSLKNCSLSNVCNTQKFISQNFAAVSILPSLNTDYLHCI